MTLVETPARIEPCELPSCSAPLADLLSAITASASALGARLHARTASSLETLSSRLDGYVTGDLGLPESAAKLVRAVLQRGELPRGEAGAVLSIPERTARQIVSRLIAGGLAASDTPEGPLRLRFSAASADVLFPRLFPAQA